MTKPYIHGMLPGVPAVPAKAEEPQIRFLGDMQRLQPQPGDVFVLTCEERLDSATAERIKAELSGKLGGATVLVLDCGMTLGCIAVPEKAQVKVTLKPPYLVSAEVAEQVTRQTLRQTWITRPKRDA